MYYIWGAGNIGNRAMEHLVPLGILGGIIDNDINKHDQIIKGLKVSDYDSVKPYLKESGVVIAHFSPKETELILDNDNIKHWRLSEFITKWYWKDKQQFAIGFLDFPITTRCTLNCKNCMQYIPYREKYDLPIDRLKNDLMLLFDKISFIGEVSIIGGEPFLHKQLYELLDYIQLNYRKQIGSLVITTNGTVVPNSRILNKCCELKTFISVSDYSDSLPKLNNKIRELENAARNNGIEIEKKRWKWSDPGKFDFSVGFNECTMTHMQLSDGKLWQCTLMAAGNYAGLFEACIDDYYNLYQADNELFEFLNKGLSNRTSQCLNCLYPKQIAITAATQI